MNHFATILDIAEQRRQSRADEMLPLAWQKQRIAELEGALRKLIRVGDSLRMSKAQTDFWHAEALAAEKTLNGEEAAA